MAGLRFGRVGKALPCYCVLLLPRESSAARVPNAACLCIGLVAVLRIPRGVGEAGVDAIEG